MTKLSECRNALQATQAELAACKAESAAKDTTISQQKERISTLELKVTSLESQVAQLQTKSASDDAEKAALRDEVTQLKADLAACQGSIPSEPSWTEVLRDTDGVSVKSALAQMAAGDLVRLVGEFPVSSEFHFPGNDMLLGCRPGEARLVATQAMEDMVGIKSGKGAGAKNTTLLNLEVDGQQKAKNGISAWMGTKTKNVKVWNGSMTGIHCNGEGINVDFGMVFEDTDVSRNGSAGEVGHGAAGTKLFNVHGATYIRCTANDVIGNSYWSDYHCGRVEYIDCDSDHPSRRGFFREKCGRYGNPYPRAFKFGMYEDDFVRVGGKIIYDGMLVISGGSSTNALEEGGLIVASPHARVSGMTFGGNGKGVGMRVANDPGRMYDGCLNPDGTLKTNPGWMVDDVEIDRSSCVLNGDRIEVATNVPQPGRARVF